MLGKGGTAAKGAQDQAAHILGEQTLPDRSLVVCE